MTLTFILVPLVIIAQQDQLFQHHVQLVLIETAFLVELLQLVCYVDQDINAKKEQLIKELFVNKEVIVLEVLTLDNIYVLQEPIQGIELVSSFKVNVFYALSDTIVLKEPKLQSLHQQDIILISTERQVQTLKNYVQLVKLAQLLDRLLFLEVHLVLEENTVQRVLLLP